jgi:two-component system, OmpR family, phosphate regulon response regulator PhoB
MSMRRAGATNAAAGLQVQSNGIRVGIVAGADQQIALVDQHLKAVGYTVQSFGGDGAVGLLGQRAPDILLLDCVELGEASLNRLHQLRFAAETKLIPIIILAERADENAVIAALGAGADDIVHKPVSVPELLARVEALLRRRLPVKTSNVVTVGDTEFNREAVLVRRRGKTVVLGPTDRQLLDLFMTHPGKVLGRQDILLAVWGEQGTVDARTIDVHVGRLRKALLTACRSDPITTIRGAGYRFDPK